MSYTVQQGKVIAVDVINELGDAAVRHVTESPRFPGFWSIDSPIAEVDSRSIDEQIEVLLAMRDYFVDNPTPPGSPGDGDGGGDGTGGGPGGI